MMAAVAISYQATPLSSAAFIISAGAGAVWMMSRQLNPLVTAIVAVYGILLLVSSMRQGLLFGEQVITSDQLAEKREVVSMLLKEHDMEGAGWLWQTDATRRLSDVSQSFARILETEPQALEGRSVLEVLAGPDWEDGQFDPALRVLAEKLKSRTPFSDVILPVMVRGRKRWWQISASPRVDEKGTFLGFRGVGSDITAQKESSERITQLAHFDMLTNLPNRVSLTEQLALAIDNVSKRRTRCGFLMIDLDRFKSVNDTLGHLVGDQLLAQVAARLRKTCSANEICGRLGGDEFAVVIRDVPDNYYVERLSLALIETISRPYQVDTHTLFIGASVGSACVPQDGLAAETLIRSADLAMYHAKENGGGRHFSYVPSLHAEAEERRRLEIALRAAMDKDELHLAYQPVVDARTSEITGFEALLRWNHPELGAIPPSKFIPVAEEARIINAIGNWVIETACREARYWPADVRVAVNVSSDQLSDPAFVETVIGALAKAGIPAGRLELEITESAFLRDGSTVTRTLDQLIGLGIHLSLDDFGTGYSSLGYLSRTRFSTIKIDRSFVAGAAERQAECLAIVRAVVAMADSLGMMTTAEGVETEREYLLLRQLGCTRIQGFYFGRPMAAGDARALFSPPSAQGAVA
jgi:diguanylate cyclase (GGDEF)-like protein/PAS domain S-box-containing protein